MLYNTTVIDRFTLFHLLPQQGDWATLKQVRELRELLSFTDEEIARLQMRGVVHCETCKQDYEVPLPILVQPLCEKCGGETKSVSTRWNPEVSQIVPTELSLKQVKVIRAALNTLSSKKELTERHIHLCELFLEED